MLEKKDSNTQNRTEYDFDYKWKKMVTVAIKTFRYGVSVYISLDLSAHNRVTWTVSCLATFPFPAPEEPSYPYLQPAWLGHLQPDPNHQPLLWKNRTLTTLPLNHPHISTMYAPFPFPCPMFSSLWYIFFLLLSSSPPHLLKTVNHFPLQLMLWWCRSTGTESNRRRGSWLAYALWTCQARSLVDYVFWFWVTYKSECLAQTLNFLLPSCSCFFLNLLFYTQTAHFHYQFPDLSVWNTLQIFYLDFLICCLTHRLHIFPA